jgi:endonuclease III related protein
MHLVEIQASSTCTSVSGTIEARLLRRAVTPQNSSSALSGKKCIESRRLSFWNFHVLSEEKKKVEIRRYYAALHFAWGPQHWWPGDTAFEVIVGAYLTQNTAWRNVERALANLRKANTLSLQGIRQIRLRELEVLSRPSGYFRQKAQRLKTFIAFLDKNYDGSLEALFSQPTSDLREQLLCLNGIGPETADSILLYAGNHPVFVVDAYTRRILERHHILPSRVGYEEIRKLFEKALVSVTDEHKHPAPLASPAVATWGTAHPPSAMSAARRTATVQVYNEMHGLIVGVGKNYCGKTKPKCDECPLQRFLPGVK